VDFIWTQEHLYSVLPNPIRYFLMHGELTGRENDCLMAVGNLTSTGWAARVKDVAVEMQVSPPTAVEYLEKLARVKLVEKGATGYRLSAEGARQVDELVRVHRLFETLLFRTGMSLEEAHRISSSIDRHVDSKGAAVLCARLNHPKMCPHDRPIPAGDEYDYSRLAHKESGRPQ